VSTAGVEKRPSRLHVCAERRKNVVRLVNGQQAAEAAASQGLDEIMRKSKTRQHGCMRESARE